MYNLSLIQELTECYGSPLYIFKEDDFTANYLHFKNIFEKHYSRYRIAYSYKTNYTPYICQLVKALGGYAEIVSDMELQCAKKCGYTPDKIIYNGPSKGPGSIALMLEGGQINADNIEEVKRLCKAAAEHRDKQLKIGIRVNINVGQNFVSRFGIDSDSNDLAYAFELIKQEPNLTVNGLHCHISRSRTAEAWRNRASVMLELADKYFDTVPEFLDLGSGMFGVMDPFLAAQFDRQPSFEEYASAALDIIDEHYKNSECKPLVFTEPGTTLVNKYVDFVGCITSIKTIKGQDFGVMNCSQHNTGEVCALKRMPYSIISAGAAPQRITGKLVGYTCLEHDVLFPEFDDTAAVGDYIVFGNAGGYSNVFKPPFISENCAMIALNNKGESKVIKRKETFEDVFTTYIF